MSEDDLSLEELEETCELAKAGFEYFTEIDGAQVFRKRR